VADGAIRRNLHSAVNSRLLACEPGGRGASVCGGRGICEPASGVCLCDVGFYPEELDAAQPPCSREACPFFANVECGGRGRCDSEVGVCHCNLDPTYGISMFQGDDCSTDVNECAIAANPCVLAERACLNAHGSFRCGSCIEGYAETTAADGTELCADVDECAEGNGGCLGLPCVNEAGSFRCGQCEEGFRPASNPGGGEECEDVDECADASKIVILSRFVRCPSR